MSNESKCKDMKKYQKNYYNENRDQLLEYGKMRVDCKCCGKKINRNSMPYHIKTQKCIDNEI